MRIDHLAPRLLCAAVMLAAVMLVPPPAPAQEPDAQEQPPAPSPLAAEPDTAAERIDAALLMLKLTRMDLARQYIQEVLDAQPTNAQLLELRNEFGTATFLQLSRVDELNPPAQELLDRVIQAAQEQVADPQYVQSAIRELQGSPAARDAAIRQLRQIGAKAVPPLLQATRTATPEERVAILTGLARLGAPASDPLNAALDATDPTIRSIAIKALGYVGSEEDVPMLLTHAFGDRELAANRVDARRAIARIRYRDPNLADRVTSYGISTELRRAAMAHLTHAASWDLDDSGMVTYWLYDPDTDQIVGRTAPPAEADRALALRLARNAYEFDETNDASRTLLVAVALANDLQERGYDAVDEHVSDVQTRAALLGPQRITAVLQLALDSGDAAAALSALEILQRLGGTDLLRPDATGRSLLSRAMNSPNRRVQFRAAELVVLLARPLDPVPQPARVVEILAAAISSDAGSRSVVVDPNLRRGRGVGQALVSAGIPAEVVGTGREGFTIAAKQGDVQLAIFHLNTVQWPLSMTLSNFRADARTANIPLVIYGPLGMRENVRHELERDPNTTYWPLEAASAAETLANNVMPTLRQLAVPVPSPEWFAMTRARAVQLLRQIALQHADRFPLERAEDEVASVANQPELSGDAIVVLSHIGTRSAQQRLTDLAVDSGSSEEIRRQAAIALARHIRRHSVLLNDEAVQSVFNALADVQSDQVRGPLAAVVGLLDPRPELIEDVYDSF